jgi:molybdate-binding protein
MARTSKPTPYQPLSLSFEQLKALADPRRLAILRSLMATPGTLTSLGLALSEHPAWVRHHLLALEQARLVLLDHSVSSGGRTEKFYRAAAPVLVLQKAILPDYPGQETALFMGSHDLALETSLRAWLDPHAVQTPLVCLPVGSLDGLTALRQGLCHIAGCHLLDVEGSEYNLPYVRRFFPDREMTLITLAERQQGLMLPPGNPHRLRSLADLVQPGLRLANRQRGSGTRLWLDRQLAQLGIPVDSIGGYTREYPTHTSVATSIQQGRADCGIGLLAAARQLGLDFLPLFHERYDLVLPSENRSLPALQPLLNQVTSLAFKHLCASMGGYETRHSGSQYEVRLSTPPPVIPTQGAS